MKTIEVEIAVANYFGYRQNLIVPNVSWGMGLHECDVLIFTKCNYLIEVEIKVSKHDLIKDLQKRHGHYNDRIKKLYFAIPEKLRECIGYIPQRAGVLIAREVNNYKRYTCSLEREALANKLAKPANDKDKFDIARLGALRIWNLKQKIIRHEKENDK